VQQLARKGRPVGIVDLASKRRLPPGDLESRAQKYVTVRLAESIFREFSSLLEEYILGLIRLWLTAYPEDLAFTAMAHFQLGQRDVAHAALNRLRKLVEEPPGSSQQVKVFLREAEQLIERNPAAPPGPASTPGAP
jgi:hypothetical protein